MDTVFTHLHGFAVRHGTRREFRCGPSERVQINGAIDAFRESPFEKSFCKILLYNLNDGTYWYVHVNVDTNMTNTSITCRGTIF